MIGRTKSVVNLFSNPRKIKLASETPFLCTLPQKWGRVLFVIMKKSVVIHNKPAKIQPVVVKSSSVWYNEFKEGDRYARENIHCYRP